MTSTPAPPDPPPGAADPGAAYDAETVARHLDAVRNAVGSVRLEGLEPDTATVADMERVARGELTFEAAGAALLARIASERRGNERKVPARELR